MEGKTCWPRADTFPTIDQLFLAPFQGKDGGKAKPLKAKKKKDDPNFMDDDDVSAVCLHTFQSERELRKLQQKAHIFCAFSFSGRLQGEAEGR